MENNWSVVDGCRVGFSMKKIAHLIETSFFNCVGTIVIVGIVLRLALIWLTTSSMEPFNQLYPGYSDGEDYMNIARSLVETGVFGYAGRPTAFRSPAYPFSIAVFWKMFGETLTPVRLFQIALFVIMTLCYTHVTNKYFGKLAAVLTAIVFSSYPLFAFMTTEIATESLYMALASVIFALTLTLINKEQANNKVIVAFCTGVCCGVGTLTRPNMLFVFLMVQALMVWYALTRREPLRKWVTPIIGLWLGAFLTVTPWLIRNQLKIGAPVLATNIDYNLYRGTFDLANDGIPFGPAKIAVFHAHNVMYEDEIENPRNSQLSLGEVESEQNARAAAVAAIRADPIFWLKERVRNVAILFLNLQWDFGILKENQKAVVAAVSVTIVYYVLLLSAIVGSVSFFISDTNLEQRQFVAVAWAFILAAMSAVITIVGKRYRVAMIDPYLAMLACVAVSSWFDRLRRSVPAK
jgi:4-amino-4-deoxy-L-arabinose transferase-like glycosyltransferase